jgi:hypothetical protein
MMENKKYRFDVISTITGRQEPYIGLFKNRYEALAWYENHGKWHKKRGRPLILVQCVTQYADNEFDETDNIIEDNNC